MNKILVPKETHIALGKLRTIRSPSEIYDSIVNQHGFVSSSHFIVENYDVVNKWFENKTAETLMKALVCGTEPEATPEEKIKERYENTKSYAKHSNYDYRSGMQYVLNTLNIKIKGVNT